MPINKNKIKSRQHLIDCEHVCVRVCTCEHACLVMFATHKDTDKTHERHNLKKWSTSLKCQSCNGFITYGAPFMSVCSSCEDDKYEFIIITTTGTASSRVYYLHFIQNTQPEKRSDAHQRYCVIRSRLGNCLFRKLNVTFLKNHESGAHLSEVVVLNIHLYRRVSSSLVLCNNCSAFVLTSQSF